MDSYHRQIPARDSRVGRDCKFCSQFDPDFTKRNLLDRWVELEDSANSHLTENGHVRHRLSELARKRAVTHPGPALVKSA
jgi:hypothetical protein